MMCRFGTAFVLAILCGAALVAQAPAGKVTIPGVVAPAGAPDKPALSDLETAWVQIAALSQQLASCQSQQLDSVKQFTSIHADVLGRIEASHPGFTVDWTTGKLVAKAPEKGPK